MERVPRASRPLHNLYKAIYEVIKDDEHLNMTRKQFVGAVMKKVGGNASPDYIMNVYYQLMQDAGLEMLNDE